MAELVDRTGLGLIAGGALVYFGRAELFAGERERELAKLAGLGLGLAGVLRIVSGVLRRGIGPTALTTFVGEENLERAADLARDVKDAVLPGPGPVPGTGVSVPILGGPLVPLRELPHSTEPPPGESFGIVSGPLVSPVVAAIVSPFQGGKATRPRLSKRFPVTIELQNFTDRDQPIVVDANVKTSTAFGTKPTIGERILARTIQPRALEKLTANLDSGSLFELGDLTVTVQLLVNNKPTQSVSFEVE